MFAMRRCSSGIDMNGTFFTFCVNLLPTPPLPIYELQNGDEKNSNYVVIKNINILLHLDSSLVNVHLKVKKDTYREG